MNDMTPELERLLQRFLDQELSPEERIRFIAQLGRSEDLRARAIEMEQLLLGVSRLPRPRVPHGFAEGVLERAAPVASNRARLAGVLFDPRAMRWDLAGAIATAVVLLLVVAGIVARNTKGPVTAMPATVLVRLVILQPGARSVEVAGDFNGWNPARTPLDEASAGAWTVTIPLEPGRYEYMYVVDGQQWIADPFAVEHSDDGFGSRNAVLEVRPTGAAGAL